MTYQLTDLTVPVHTAAQALIGDDPTLANVEPVERRRILKDVLAVVLPAAPVIAVDVLGYVEGALLRGLDHEASCGSLYDDDTICDCHGDILKVLAEVRDQASA